MKLINKISLFVVIFSALLLGQTGCEKFLDQQPLSELSESVFIVKR